MGKGRGRGKGRSKYGSHASFFGWKNGGDLFLSRRRRRRRRGGWGGGRGKSFVILGTEKRAARRDRYRSGLFLGGEEKIHSAGRKKKGDRYSYFAPGREEEFLRFPTFWKKEIPVPFFTFPYAPHAHFPLVIFPNLIDIVRIIWTVQ